MVVLKGFLAALLIASVIFAVVVALVGREKLLEKVFGPVVIAQVDFNTLVLAPSPNQYLVCPEDYCSQALTDEIKKDPARYLRSPVFHLPVGQLERKWQAMIERQPRIELGDKDEEYRQFDFIQRTEWVRYPDSITVRFISLDENRSTLVIYSRSHYGRNDFGVNKQRIDQWLGEL